MPSAWASCSSARTSATKRLAPEHLGDGPLVEPRLTGGGRDGGRIADRSSVTEVGRHQPLVDGVLHSVPVRHLQRAMRR